MSGEDEIKNPFNPLLFNTKEEFLKNEEELSSKKLPKRKYKPYNQEGKIKCSERAKKRFANKENHPNYGKHQSVEWKNKISVAMKEKYANLSESEKQARVEKQLLYWTEENRRVAGERMSRALKGKPNCRTPPASNTRTSSIQGIRTDLNWFFRSTWEANIARVLNYLNIKWEYEPYRFIFEHFSYVPDFYLPETDSWVEVYSYLTKLKAAKIISTGRVANLQLINHDIYNELEKEYKDRIPNWETNKSRQGRKNPLVIP